MIIVYLNSEYILEYFKVSGPHLCYSFFHITALIASKKDRTDAVSNQVN